MKRAEHLSKVSSVVDLHPRIPALRMFGCEKLGLEDPCSRILVDVEAYALVRQRKQE